jgi:hypothetical protein
MMIRITREPSTSSLFFCLEETTTSILRIYYVNVMCTCQKINSGRGWTSDVAVAIDLEAVERRRHLGRVRVVEVGPAGDGVAADVGVRHARCLRRAPHLTLLLVESQPRTHRPRAVHVVPELRRQKPLQSTRVRRARSRRTEKTFEYGRVQLPSPCRRFEWRR